MGLPRKRESAACSTEAKNASASRWTMDLGGSMVHFRLRIRATMTPWMTSSPAGKEFGIFGVFGAEMRLALVGHESFERAFSVNQRRHDIAVARGLAVFNHHHVAVHDVFANHGIPPHFQGEGARDWV
jgi:hypothetical protein